MAYIDIDDKAAETIIGALAAKVVVLKFQLDNAMDREDKAHKGAEYQRERKYRYLDALYKIRDLTKGGEPAIDDIRQVLSDLGVF